MCIRVHGRTFGYSKTMWLKMYCVMESFRDNVRPYTCLRREICVNQSVKSKSWLPLEASGRCWGKECAEHVWFFSWCRIWFREIIRGYIIHVRIHQLLIIYIYIYLWLIILHTYSWDQSEKWNGMSSSDNYRKSLNSVRITGEDDDSRRTAKLSFSTVVLELSVRSCILSLIAA